MPTRVPNITTLKSTKSIALKKTLIVAAAVSGLIAAGALAYVTVKSAEEMVEEAAE